MLIKGITEFIIDDVEEARRNCITARSYRGPLMDGMNVLETYLVMGKCFATGR